MHVIFLQISLTFLHSFSLTCLSFGHTTKRRVHSPLSLLPVLCFLCFLSFIFGYTIDVLLAVELFHKVVYFYVFFLAEAHKKKNSKEIIKKNFLFFSSTPLHLHLHFKAAQEAHIFISELKTQSRAYFLGYF
jgi:hypothetical protein